jgi:hypothetical protein
VTPRWLQAARGYTVYEPAQGKALAWLKGMGVSMAPENRQMYDAVYWERYRALDRTEMGSMLTEKRMQFVHQYTSAYGLVDIGIGGGRFLRETNCFGYDVNPAAIVWLKARGRWLDVTRNTCMSMTFFDSLEHALDWDAILDNCRRWAFVSTPIYEDAAHCLRSKHFKPGEHMLYFTHEGLLWFMRQYGFEYRAGSNFETRLGRDSIGTFAFEKKARRAAG